MKTIVLQYLPALLICLGLKGCRAQLLLPDAMGPLQLLNAWSQDVGVHLLLLGVACLLLSTTASRGARIFGQIALGVAALGAMLLEFVAVIFAYETGLGLDHHLFEYALVNLVMVLPVIFAEVDPGRTLSLALIATGLVGWRLWRIIRTSVGPVSARSALVLTATGAAALATPPLAVSYWVAVAMPVELLAGPFLHPVERAGDPRLPSYRADAKLTPREDGSAPRYDHVAVVALESTGWFASSLAEDGPRTTPFLEELARDSVSFERAYAVVPHSSKAVVSIGCGIVPYLLMEVREAEGLPVPCLPALLREQGFQTNYFGSHVGGFEGWRRLMRNMGFAVTTTVENLDTAGFEPVSYFGVEDEILLSPVQRFLRRHAGRHTLLFLLTSTAHHDYQTPSRYPTREFSEHEKQNRYLNGVHYQDRFLEKLLDIYRSAGVYERTLFVIVGDHGEGFGEHGRNLHDTVIYDEALRVPLLIHAAGLAPSRNRRVVSHLDILPTIVELLGYEIEGGSYDGVDAFRSGDDPMVFASCWYSERCLARIGARRKLISHYDHLPPEAYDLEADPRERENLFGRTESDAADLRALHDWKARQLGRFERFLDNRSGEAAPDAG